MTIKQLKEYLSNYPDDMPVMLLTNIDNYTREPVDLDKEKILHTSETAYFLESDDEDKPDEWGLGNGKQYLLINPIIV